MKPITWEALRDLELEEAEVETPIEGSRVILRLRTVYLVVLFYMICTYRKDLLQTKPLPEGTYRSTLAAVL